MNKSFFKELSRILAEQDIEIAPPANGRLSILINGHPVCRVQADGMLCMASGDLMTPEAGALRHKVAPVAEMVYEYTSLVEKAPLPKSDSNNADYRLLADFNGVILAGKETSQAISLSHGGTTLWAAGMNWGRILGITTPQQRRALFAGRA